MNIEDIFDDCRGIATAVKNNLPKLKLIESTRPKILKLVMENMNFFYVNNELVYSSNYKYFRDNKKEFIKLLNKYKIKHS